MKVFVNGQPVNPAQVAGRSLEEMLVDIMGKHLPAEHSIKRVMLNSEHYIEEVPHDAAKVDRDQIERLEIETLSPEEVADAFAQNGHHQLQTIIEAAPKVAELFRVADEAEANEHYLVFLETLQLLLHMIVRVGELMDLDFSAISADGMSADTGLEKVKRVVDEMLSVQEDQDWVLLADVLEYDLVPALRPWLDILPQLKAKGH